MGKPENAKTLPVLRMIIQFKLFSSLVLILIIGLIEKCSSNVRSSNAFIDFRSDQNEIISLITANPLSEHPIRAPNYKFNLVSSILNVRGGIKKSGSKPKSGPNKLEIRAKKVSISYALFQF